MHLSSTARLGSSALWRSVSSARCGTLATVQTSTCVPTSVLLPMPRTSTTWP
ncbi:hypothetical protein E2C01_095159 [Portunus trituberculatus]|uniref:Uncharacterized protein n=1 Tax=Portunus trituberculatus TaxID=210409 RepID=A0A5B7K3H2_PORTR|nr:hypothetical protein [Portunus trituberculatus]